MRCSTDDFGNPPARLGVYRNGGDTAFRRGSAGQNFTWKVSSVWPYLNADWECKAVNSAGTTNSVKVELRIYGKYEINFK